MGRYVKYKFLGMGYSGYAVERILIVMGLIHVGLMYASYIEVCDILIDMRFGFCVVCMHYDMPRNNAS